MARQSWQTWARWRHGWRCIWWWLPDLFSKERRYSAPAIRDELRYLFWTHWRGYPKAYFSKGDGE